MTKESLIEKLEAVRKTLALDEWKRIGNQVLDVAIAIVDQHEAEVIIENDRVCIAGKWFVPAEGTTEPASPTSESSRVNQLKAMLHLVPTKDLWDKVASLLEWARKDMGDAETAKSGRKHDELMTGQPSPVDDGDNGNAAAIAAQDWVNANGRVITISEAADLVSAIRPYLRTTEPEPVSLEKCARAVFELDDSEQDAEVIAKTVLEAAKVPYVV